MVLQLVPEISPEQENMTEGKLSDSIICAFIKRELYFERLRKNDKLEGTRTFSKVTRTIETPITLRKGETGARERPKQQKNRDYTRGIGFSKFEDFLKRGRVDFIFED
uniref:uncharacterized protein LOC117607102 n=1 Tax=Osmia lignaria TaxID=473952 RepID=UPI0014780A18|nr:uncharacterized protein LOC117607102 [Osmia lignaria]XP_034186259.1 uncharacterized protein LOC117607102 [Osmia lignaria]